MNNCIFTGHVGKDAALSYTGGGKPVLGFSIAVNEPYMKDNEWKTHTEWIDCSWFGGKRAERIKILKGNKVLIQGRYRTNKWIDKESGEQRSKVYFLVDRLEVFNIEKKTPEGQNVASSEGLNTNSSFTAEDIPF